MLQHIVDQLQRGVPLPMLDDLERLLVLRGIRKIEDIEALAGKLGILDQLPEFRLNLRRARMRRLLIRIFSCCHACHHPFDIDHSPPARA